MSLKCHACGAPLKQGDKSCSYCLAKVDLDIRGVHYFTKVKPVEERQCASCSTPMDTLNLKLGQDFFIEQCSQCYSLFFDPGELEFLLKHTVNESEMVQHLKLNELVNEHFDMDTKVQYKPCPVCSKIMNRQNYGARSGVIIDYCKEHGIFLDSGELSRLFQWKKAGGAKHDQQMKQWQEEIQTKRDNRKAQDIKSEERKINSHEASSNYIVSSYSSPSSNPLDTLVDALNFMIRLFR